MNTKTYRARKNRVVAGLVTAAITLTTFAGTVAGATPASADTLDDLIDAGIVEIIDADEVGTIAPDEAADIEPDDAADEVAVTIELPSAHLAANETLWHQTTFSNAPQIPNNSTLRAFIGNGVTMTGDEEFNFSFTGGNSSANAGEFLVTGGNRQITTTLPDQGADVRYRVEIVFASHDNNLARGISLEGNPEPVILTGAGTTNWLTISDEFAGGTPIIIRTFGEPLATGAAGSGNIRIQAIRIIEIDNRVTTPEVIEELWHGISFAGNPGGAQNTPLSGLDNAVLDGLNNSFDFDLVRTGNSSGMQNVGGGWISFGGAINDSNRSVRANSPLPTNEGDFRVEIDFKTGSNNAARNISLINQTTGAVLATSADSVLNGTNEPVVTLTHTFEQGSPAPLLALISSADVRLHAIRIFRISLPTGDAPATPENLSAKTGISETVVLSWDSVRDADNYQVLVNGTQVSDTQSTEYSVSGLTNGTEYTFSVIAQNANGQSEPAAITATPQVAEAIELQADAWFETVFATFTAPNNANIIVQVRQGDGAWENVDQELVRVVDASRNAWRVDVPGRLANVSHELRIRQIESGNIVAEGISILLTPQAFDRQGGAFFEGTTTGGYNADGTVPENANIIYVTPENANRVLSEQAFPATGGNANNRPNTPTIIRVLGQIGSIDFVGDTANIPPAARANYFWNIRARENVTIEGIGPDALLYGFGIQVHNSRNVEIRNLSIDMYFDDAIGIHGNNAGATSSHYWIHNNRVFYGQDRHTFLGEDEDLIFGDGGIDITNHARNFTIDNNQLMGTYKAMLLGNARTDVIANGTVHHNWFYAVGSRLPRVRNAQVHVFNNVFEDVHGYGIGAGHEASIVSEGNVFLNTNRPYLISGQGSAGLGTLSSDYPGAIMTSVNDNGFLGRPLVADALDAASDSTVNWSEDIGLVLSNPRGEHTFDGVAFPVTDTGIGVQAAAAAEQTVRSNAGPIGGFAPSAAPRQPVISKATINAEVRAGLNEENVVVAEGTFFIRWEGDLISEFYTIQWDQGTGVWEDVATVARTGRPTEFLTTTQMAEVGGTYSFRVIARNIAGSEMSDVATVTYEMPSAATMLQSSPILGGVTLDFTEPSPVGVSYEIHMFMVQTAYGTPIANATPVTFVTSSLPFDAVGLVAGTYRVEIRTLVGGFRSEPLIGNIDVNPWRIQANDLTNPVWQEDFANGWENGPVRGEDASRLGLAILTGTGSPFNSTNGASARWPEGIIPGRLDVFVDDDGLRLQDVAAPIIDTNPATGAGSFVIQEAVGMFINIGEPVTEGRVMVDLGLQYVRSTNGNGMRPIRLWDSNGIAIVDRRVDELPAVPISEEQQHATADQAREGIVTDHSELLHWQIVLDMNTRRFDMFLNGNVFLFDQPFPAGATGGLQWIGAVTPTGNQSSHNWSELSASYRSISVFTPGEISVPDVVEGDGFEADRTETFPEAEQVFDGGPVTMTLAVTPTMAHSIMNVQWLRNGLPFNDGVVSIERQIGGGYLVSLTIPAVSSADAGTFTLEMSLLDENGYALFRDVSESLELSVVEPEAVTPEPIPTIPTIPAWDASTIYNTGDRVRFNGRVFQAQWWVQGTDPIDSGPWGSWMEISVHFTPDGSVYDVWTPDRVFDTGDIVYWEGGLYQAQWWTRNQTPDTQWGPWTNLGPIS